MSTFYRSIFGLLFFTFISFGVSAQEHTPAAKKYTLEYENVYTIAADEILNNWDRVESSIPNEVQLIKTATEIEQKNLKGGSFKLKAYRVNLRIRLSAEEFARGFVSYKRASKISNPSFASSYAASLTNIEKGVFFRPAGRLESNKIFPDYIFQMDLDTSKAKNAADLREEILKDLNGEWPKVSRLHRLEFPNYLSILRNNPNQSMIRDAIPDEFIQSEEAYSEAWIDPITKEPGIIFGDKTSLSLIVSEQQIRDGSVELHKITPAFHDDESAHILAKFLSKPEMGIEVRAEDVLNESGSKRATRQIWTVDLSKAANFESATR